jgi:hypothetical protein
MGELTRVFVDGREIAVNSVVLMRSCFSRVATVVIIGGSIPPTAACRTHRAPGLEGLWVS